MRFPAASHRRPLMSHVVIGFFFSSFCRDWCKQTHTQPPGRCPKIADVPNRCPGILLCFPLAAGLCDWSIVGNLGANCFNFDCACSASLWWEMGCQYWCSLCPGSLIYSCMRLFPSCCRQAGSPGPTSSSSVDAVADGTWWCCCLWWERGVCIGDLLSTLLCCVSKESFYQFIQELTLPF